MSLLTIPSVVDHALQNPMDIYAAAMFQLNISRRISQVSAWPAIKAVHLESQKPYAQ